VTRCAICVGSTTECRFSRQRLPGFKVSMPAGTSQELQNIFKKSRQFDNFGQYDVKKTIYGALIS